MYRILNLTSTKMLDCADLVGQAIDKVLPENTESDDVAADVTTERLEPLTEVDDVTPAAAVAEAAVVESAVVVPVAADVIGTAVETAVASKKPKRMYDNFSYYRILPGKRHM